MLQSTVTTKEAALEDSRLVFEKIASGDPGLFKQAESTINSITRLMVREDGIYRAVMQPKVYAASEYDRSLTTQHLMKVCELEPRSPAALTLPIAGSPSRLYIRANRYPVTLRRYATHVFMVDVAELLSWHADLRQIISDNSIKDLQAEEDANFFVGVNDIIVGANATVPTSGVIQYKTINGAVDIDSWVEAMKIMPSCPASLEAKYVIVNNVTVWDLCKLTAVEVGESITGEIVRKGWTMTEFMGKELIVTIKKGLVPHRNLYMIADTDFVGKAFLAEDVTMHVKRDGHMVSFYSTLYGGAAIGNSSGVARAVFTG